MKKLLLVSLLVTATGSIAFTQTSGAFVLTIDNVMRGPELVGYPPSNLRWSGDSKQLYFEWQMPREDLAATWVVGRDGGAPKRLTDDERRLAPLTNGTWDAKHRRVLGVDRGDIVVIDTVAHKRIDVTRMTGNESSPRWTRGETHVTFVRDNNLFIVPVEGVDGGAVVQLTDIGPRRTDPRTTDSQKFIKDEEPKLIDWVQEEAARRKRREALDKTRALPRFEITDRQTLADGALTADGKFAFLTVVDRAQPHTVEVPRYVSESSYTEPINARTYVGDSQDVRRLAVLNLETGDAVWAGLEGILDPVPIPKPLDPSETSAPALSEAGAGRGAGGGRVEGRADKKREVRWSNPLLSPDGKTAVANVRSADNTDRWIVRIDPATGKTTILDSLHDDAWIREIGGFGNGGGMGWLPDNRRLWFASELDGWMHLYTVDATSATPRRNHITKGRFEIDNVELSPDGTQFYFQSTEVHPGERQIYSVSVEGGDSANRVRLTTATGSHTQAISPDNSMFGLISSSANKPPEVFLMPNKAGATPTKVTTSPSTEWQSYKWLEPRLITYKTRDGVDVYARLYTPEMVGAKRDEKKPAVIFVHGAGYAQNAHKYWSTYYREYMFHHFLASKGYVVLDPDYRASAGYGRDWRTAIYRWMGGKDLDDVVDGAAYLVKTERVDPKRIGVYGGSYGGFITLMALFTSPDTFAAGAALRPVTDWTHYNHGYTSNILNEPQTDSEAYRKSSPIYFAQNLKAALLICHGMVDTNVLFQDSVRLVQRLIELHKENWELAVFPVEDHGFLEASSWADEYKRIFKLFETHLKK